MYTLVIRMWLVSLSATPVKTGSMEMSMRAPLQKLRGSDPVLLEVQVQDLLNRPMAQLEPANLADVFALAELDTVPKRLKRALEKFVERAMAEMAELPDGGSVKKFAAEISEVEPSRVPQTLRDHLRALAHRDGRDPEPFLTALLKLESAEPVPFELGKGETKPQRASLAPSSSTRSSRSSGKTRTRRVASTPIVDSEKHDYLCQMVMDRLESSANNELGEKVLIAGVQHRAKDKYPRVLPHDVNAAMQDLLKKGMVRKTATRWSSARRRH